MVRVALAWPGMERAAACDSRTSSVAISLGFPQGRPAPRRRLGPRSTRLLAPARRRHIRVDHVDDDLPFPVRVPENRRVLADIVNGFALGTVEIHFVRPQ